MWGPGGVGFPASKTGYFDVINGHIIADPNSLSINKIIEFKAIEYQMVGADFSITKVEKL